MPALTMETLTLAPLALGYLIFLNTRNELTFGPAGLDNALLLIGVGVFTAVPLLLFGAAATRLPLSSLGLLQYIAPTLHFLIALLVLHEPMSRARWIGFVMVWFALIIFTADAIVKGRANQKNAGRQAPEQRSVPIASHRARCSSPAKPILRAPRFRHPEDPARLG